MYSKSTVIHLYPRIPSHSPPHLQLLTMMASAIVLPCSSVPSPFVPISHPASARYEKPETAKCRAHRVCNFRECNPCWRDPAKQVHFAPSPLAYSLLTFRETSRGEPLDVNVIGRGGWGKLNRQAACSSEWSLAVTFRFCVSVSVCVCVSVSECFPWWRVRRGVIFCSKFKFNKGIFFTKVESDYSLYKTKWVAHIYFLLNLVVIIFLCS